MDARYITLAAWLLLAPAAPVAAQGLTATIGGTVRADSGDVLEGATVTAENRATGLVRSATTGPDGRYAIAGLPRTGDYDVRSELGGFASVLRRKTAVAADETIVIDFVMTVATSETVAVTGAGAVDGRHAAPHQTLSRDLVATLPLVGRDFLHLTSLAAGFTGNPDFPFPQGQMYWANNVIVDGASHFSKWRSAPRSFYSGYGLDAIREVDVLTTLFSPEFGDALATVTNVVTMSGSNDFDGSARLFVRSGALDAPPEFAVGTPSSDAEQFGASLGGPLARNRAYFWGSYEGRRSRDQRVVVSPAAPRALVPNDQDEHLTFFRVDQPSSVGRVVTARYSGQRFRWHDEFGGLALPGTGDSYATDVHTLLFSDSRQLSPHTVNALRGQFARYADVRRDLQPSVFVSRAGYSIEGGVLGPLGFGADPEDTWESSDTVSASRGAHDLKGGGGARYVRAHTVFQEYGFGAYFFGGAPSVFSQPLLFMQRVGTREAGTADPRSISAFGFVQDAWRVRPDVTLNLGLRYDVERVSGVRGYDAPVDQNNVQPRLGAVWDPGGRSRVLLRGGVGLYTQQHLLYPINRVQLEGLEGTMAIVVSPESPQMPVFPATLGAVSPDAVLPPRDVYGVDRALANPYSIQAVAGASTRLAGARISADYVYLAGLDLMSLIDVNAPASNVKPAQRTVTDADETRPIEGKPNTYRKLITLGNLGRSWYRALQVKAERSAGRLQLVASYTLARAEDMDNYQLPEDSRDILADKGRALTDVRHNIVVAATWELPGSRPLLRGWQVSGIGAFRSHRPYNITWGDDRNGTTQNDARPGDRNTGQTDRFDTVDLAVTRRLHPRGARAIETRIEAYNVFNTTNFDRYVGELLSPFFGMPVSAFPKRRVQLAITVRF